MRETTMFGELLQHEIPGLRRYARTLTRKQSTADELVQECLLRAWEKQHHFVPGSNLRAWLFTILRNQYINSVRRASREHHYWEEHNVMYGSSSTSSPDAELRLIVDDLEHGLRQMPEGQRLTVLLIGLWGMRYEEVARMLDIPIGTVRSRLSRGRQVLHNYVNGELPAKPSKRTVKTPPVDAY